MKSRTNRKFRKLYRKLPRDVRRNARRAYKVWKSNHAHPSLRFKRVDPNHPIYSARVGLSHRALGWLEGDTIHWYWIGDHDEYDRLLGGS